LRRGRRRASRRRRLGQADLDQPLDHVGGPPDVEPEAVQKDKAETELNQRDPADSEGALAPINAGASGHLPALTG
jgi:hypothetical protein